MINDAKLWNAIHRKQYETNEWHSHYAEEKEKLFPKESIVVDLGGGTGADALYFLQKGHSVVLLDISEFAVKVALEKIKKAGFSDRFVVRQVDYGLNELPLKNNSVDAVYSRISLNYFPSDQTIKILCEINRVLKKGRKAYLTFKSPEDKTEMEYLEKTAVVYEPGVYIHNGQLRSRFTKEQLVEILSKTGIKNYNIIPYQEKLSEKKEGHHPVLFTNEVIITRS